MGIDITDEEVVYIIANAGDSRSSAMAAVEAAKAGDFAEAHSCLDQSEEAFKLGHEAHTNLILKENGDRVNVTLLLIHASNHLSVAEVTLDFARQFVELYEKGVK